MNDAVADLELLPAGIPTPRRLEADARAAQKANADRLEAEAQAKAERAARARHAQTCLFGTTDRGLAD